VESAPQEDREPLLSRIAFLNTQVFDVASSLRMLELVDTTGKEDFYTAVNLSNLTATDRWGEVADFYAKMLENVTSTRNPNASARFDGNLAVNFAHAAAAMRQAGRHEEAAACDIWVE